MRMIWRLLRRKVIKSSPLMRKYALAIVASSHTEFAQKAARTLKLLHSKTPFSGPFPVGVSVSDTAPPKGKIAFLFSGQGSQYVGMGADLAMAFPAARSVWDKAAQFGLTLHDAAFPPAPFTDDEAKAQTARLTAMEMAQPAIAATALSQLALLKALGLKADCTGGHSFGELVAPLPCGHVQRQGMLVIGSAARARLWRKPRRPQKARCWQFRRALQMCWAY